MKAIDIKTETQSESEADYETAIDIAYYTFNKTIGRPKNNTRINQ